VFSEIFFKPSHPIVGGTMKKLLLSIGLACALAFGVLGFSATPFAPATQKAQAVSWTNCYWGMDGFQYCYKRCSQWEIIVLREPNCNRWVRYTNVIWA
jgi:hypothetical protein